LYVKTPNKNINNTPIGKRSLNEDNNVSITTIRESRNYNENSYLKKLDSKKNLQNLKTKSTGKIKSVIPTGGLGHEIKNKITKKLNEKILKDQNNSNIVESENKNIDNKKTKIFRYTQSDLLDAEKELNVSNIIQIQSEISDDLLLYNKEDQFLNSAFNKNNINIDEDYMNEIQTFNVKGFNINLDSEEILDDKWDDIRQFISLREISVLSLTNKKIGKNAILEIIQELEKEKNYFEEKVLSSVKYIKF